MLKVAVCLIAAGIVLTASLGAGELSFEVNPSTQILKVGDTLTLTMKIIIYGLAEKYDVEPLSKLELPGFQTISTAPRHRRGQENGQEYEERIMTFRMVAQEAGSYTIPALEIPFGSIPDGQRSLLSSQPIAITVYPGGNASRGHVIYIIGIFGLVILLSVAGFFIWLRRIKSHQFHDEEKQNINAKFASWAEELQRHLSLGRKDVFITQAYSYVNEFIEESFRLGLKGSKHEKRLALMQEKHVPGRLVGLYQKVHDHMQAIKFGGLSPESTELAGILDELKQIEQYVKS